MFGWEESKSVPMDRLTANLERRLAGNTNDPTTLYQLARLYSMRGATLSNSMTVGKRSEEPIFGFPGSDNGIPPLTNALANRDLRTQSLAYFTNALRYFGRALEQLPQSTNQSDRWLILPARLGYAWTLEQAGRTNEATREYRRTLKEAWAAEMQVSVQDWLDQMKYSWQAGRWLGGPQPRIGPGICFSEETIRYLLNCLDPVADAAEIADLKQRQAKVATLPRAITPILVPATAERELARLVNPVAGVSFDLDGSGQPRRWGWIQDNASWLVWDPGETGQITSGLQLVGGVTFWIFWRDGYEVLDALDDNGDGQLDGTELEGFALWRDRNSDGQSDPQEVTPVSRAGLRELRCSPVVHPTGIPYHPEGAVFDDSTRRPTFDWFPVVMPLRPVSCM